MKIRHVSTGDHFVDSGLLIAYGDAEVQASGTATVILFDRASCVASGDAHVTARGTNNVHISERVEADIGGSAFLEAWGDTHYILKDKARGHVGGNSEGYILGEASVDAHGDARGTMMSKGRLSVSGNACIILACGPAYNQGGAKGLSLLVTEQSMQEAAEELDKLQATKNDGRGVSCVRTICDYLKRGDISSALAVAVNESDKLSNYDDIVEALCDAGYWWELDFSQD